ncbi:MAG: PAS domain-containing protein, partial [Acidimicrobiia bacterium]|nr:PAS domain-containing protein [Acidimicrobiia bacterium]
MEPVSHNVPDSDGLGALPGDVSGDTRLLDCQSELLSLLELLVNVMFCMKGVDGRYLAVNAAFVSRAGKKSKREVIGRRAGELFREELAARYEQQDAQVFATGEPLRDELELIRREDGSLGWYLTTKLPVFADDGGDPNSGSEAGTVIGLVSISADLNTDQNAPEMEELRGMIDFVHRSIDGPGDRTIRNADL